MLHMPWPLAMYSAIWSEPLSASVLGRRSSGELSSWMMRTLVGSWFLAAQLDEQAGIGVLHEVVEQAGRARLAAAVHDGDRLVGQHQALVVGA